MRLLSVIILSLTTLAVFMFIRELLPSSPWTWTGGALACAFQPVLGFIGSGVNPDGLIFLCSSVLLWSLANLLRHGATRVNTLTAALALAAGLLTKPIFFSFVPVFLAAALLAVILKRGDLRPLAAAVTLTAVIVGTVASVASVALNHPYFAVANAVASNTANSGDLGGSPAREASYILQLFAPRLPFLTDQVAGFPLRDIWINGLVGVFGWVDYGFGRSQIDLGVDLFVGLLLLGGLALIKNRRAALGSWPLLLCCVVAVCAVLGAVGVTDYQAFITGGARFEQSRYLLPLIALYGGLFALALKGLGPRIGRLALPALLVFVSLHTMSAYILTVNRYYA